MINIPQWQQPKREAIEEAMKHRTSQAMKVLIKIVKWNLN